MHVHARPLAHSHTRRHAWHSTNAHACSVDDATLIASATWTCGEEPLTEADMVSVGTCGGMAVGDTCAHQCAAGRFGGLITCMAGSAPPSTDGAWDVVACTGQQLPASSLTLRHHGAFARGATTPAPQRSSCRSFASRTAFPPPAVCPECAAVENSSARTCNAGGAAGIGTVACAAGYFAIGVQFQDLSCAGAPLMRP